MVEAVYPMQDLKAQAARAELQLSQAEADNIIKALQQLTLCLKATQALLQQWAVADKANLWQAIVRFASSKQDSQDLSEVG